MKGNRQINPEGPLCSAWELADISIRLGELLELGRPAREEALDLMDWAASYAPTVRINTRFAKRLTDDEAAESMRARILYAAKLKEPASFPISMDEFVKVISSSHDRRRRDDWRKKLSIEIRRTRAKSGATWKSVDWATPEELGIVQRSGEWWRNLSR